MTTLHEGQEVEVWRFQSGEWERAKVVAVYVGATYEGETPTSHSISVQFPDGTRAILTAQHQHIREVKP